MKLLLYCTKAKPYLWNNISSQKYMEEQGISEPSFVISKDITYSFECDLLNGKIVAECDFEVEKIRKGWGCLNGTRYFRNNVNHYYPDYELEKQSCLSFDEIDKYLKGTLNENCGYAIHIKNLHIFDEPKSIQDYSKNENPYYYIENAPQNMMYAYDVKSFNNFEKKVLISIHPEWLCKILNEEKTVEVRKKVLKEMLDNE